MKKSIFIAAFILIICILSACSTTGQTAKGDADIAKNDVDIEEAIIGEWHITEESKKVDQSDYYPEEKTLIFAADGTWNNNSSNTYIISENSITMDSRWWFHQYTYNISIDDNVLKLQYPGAEALYFTKAD